MHETINLLMEQNKVPEKYRLVIEESYKIGVFNTLKELHTYSTTKLEEVI